MTLLDLREPISAWSHAAGLALALPALLLLLWRGRGDPTKRLCLMIYGLTLVACYAASVLYHGSRGRVATLARIDLIGIYLFIAGSYTPLAGALLRGYWRWGVLAAVWLVAAGGALPIALGLAPPRVLSTALYLGMGWGSVACYFKVAQAVTHRALRPLVLGGLFYSIGAVINLLGWPAPWPGVFASHELFHLLVLAGTAAHFLFMLRVVAPFTPGEEECPPSVSRKPDSVRTDPRFDPRIAQSGSSLRISRCRRTR